MAPQQDNQTESHATSRRMRLESENTGLKGLVFFALLWNAISFTVAGLLTMKLPEELSKGNFAALIVYLFPLVGILLMGWVVKTWLHNRRFGKTELVLDPYPGAIGGQVGGEIFIHVPLPADTVYRINLQCLHSKETRNSKGQRSVSTSLEWQDDMDGRVDIGMGQTCVRFLFDVPADLPVSTPKSSNWHHWKLCISADVPGVDLDISYELPMHKSAQVSAIAIPGLARERQRMRSEQLLRALNADYQNDTLYFDFPYGREWMSSLVLLTVGVCFFGVGLGVAFRDAVIFGGIFALAGAAMMVWALYASGNRLQVAINPDSVHVRRHVLGWQVTWKQLALSELRGVKMERRSSVNNGKRFTVFYRVVVVDKDDNKWCVAESIPGRSLAEEAVRFLLGQTALRGLEERH